MANVDVSMLHRDEVQVDIIIGGYIFLALAIEGVILVGIAVVYSLCYCLVSLFEKLITWLFRPSAALHIFLLGSSGLLLVFLYFISNIYVLFYYKNLYLQTECTITNVTINYPTTQEYDANNGDWCFVIDVSYEAKGEQRNSTDFCREYFSGDPLTQSELNTLSGDKTYCFYNKANVTDIHMNAPKFASTLATEILCFNAVLLFLSPFLFTVESCIKRRRDAMKLLKETGKNYLTFSSKSSLEDLTLPLTMDTSDSPEPNEGSDAIDT